MKVLGGAILAAAMLVLSLAGQRGAGLGQSGNADPTRSDPTPVPSQAARAAADHEQNLKDLARLVQLTADLQKEVQANGEQVLSVDSLKKADELEKLSKKLHARMKTDYSTPLKVFRGGGRN